MKKIFATILLAATMTVPVSGASAATQTASVVQPETIQYCYFNLASGALDDSAKFYVAAGGTVAVDIYNVSKTNWEVKVWLLNVDTNKATAVQVLNSYDDRAYFSGLNGGTYKVMFLNSTSSSESFEADVTY